MKNGRYNSINLASKETLDNFFWKVPYDKGELTVVAYEDDSELARDTIRTATKEYKFGLSCNKQSLKANGDDSAFVIVTVYDKEGNPVNDSEILADFEITGSGVLLGQGNGKIDSHEHDKVPYRRLYGGKALVILQATKEAGKTKLVVSAGGIISAEIEFEVTAFSENIL